MTEYVVQLREGPEDIWIDQGVFDGSSGDDAMRRAARPNGVDADVVEGHYRAFPVSSDNQMMVEVDREPRVRFRPIPKVRLDEPPEIEQSVPEPEPEPAVA